MVTARGLSVADGLTLGPLTIGRVRSQSVTTYRQGADQPTTTTELAIEGGRANDLVFSFGREGFQFAQNGIPLPAGQGLGMLNQALAPTGMSVRFDEPTPLNGGAVAAAFEITNVADVPAAGKGTFTIRLGGASSYITLAAPRGGASSGGLLPPPSYRPPHSDSDRRTRRPGFAARQAVHGRHLAQRLCDRRRRFGVGQTASVPAAPVRRRAVLVARCPVPPVRRSMRPPRPVPLCRPRATNQVLALRGPAGGGAAPCRCAVGRWVRC